MQTNPATQDESFRLPPGIATFSGQWPGRKDGQPTVLPGDLSKFMVPRRDAWTEQEHTGENVFLQAPRIEESGGTVYFENDISKRDFEGLMRIMGAEHKSREYAVFVKESPNPRKDGYLLQVRIVTSFGMRHLFDAMNGFEHHAHFGSQKFPIREALWAFMEEEKRRWGTDMADEGDPLYGVSGGDGDSEHEQLSFGFKVESRYYGVYRFWSRAWIVSK